MTCDEVRPEISAYHDGELPPTRQDLVAGHLAECAACSAYLDDLVRISGLLRRGSTGRVPPDVWPRIANAAAGPRRRILFRIWAARAASVAAGFALYLLGYELATSAMQAQAPTEQQQTVQLEEVLRDAGTMLASYKPLGALPLERKPELQLIEELIEDNQP